MSIVKLYLRGLFCNMRFLGPVNRVNRDILSITAQIAIFTLACFKSALRAGQILVNET
jgi:hypothetical protein